MGACVFAFIEINHNGEWNIADNLVEDEEYEGKPVPKNVAPWWWGKSAYADIYELSGERGFPADLSAEMLSFIKEYWQDANRPSWLLMSELKHLQEDANSRCPAIDLTLFPGALPDSEVRLVFWADQ
ncbi:hypothetical protein EUZ85_18180 [Hahella sp. KA22]|uniref:hypothetical protein n=1 Tax=Hahella sp. KA22 TaxID=1628392 RepID=UPI000FDD3378|nr:hypothetical protein [Hahella sp. KA22]AZZ92544.1 hypothetical protein ENC22_15605 [Hahella sp. KA22]QAY55917.1 hypothetical protein EUZ85_18180 [Hahella sp. KA22]